MKKLLLLGLMAMVLILGACNKEETTTGKEKELNSTENLEADIKDNELVIEVGGKKEVEPAKIEKNVTDFIKEIKVPENAEVNVDNESGAYVVEENGLKFAYLEAEADELVTTERILERYKRKMELTNPSGEIVPVNEVDLNKYPSLKDKFDAMMMVDGETEKEFLLVKIYEEDGKKYKKEANFYISAESYNERELAKAVAILSSLK